MKVFMTRYVYNSSCNVNQVKYELVRPLSHVLAMCKRINRPIVNVSYADVVKRSAVHELGHVVNSVKAEFTHEPGRSNFTKIVKKPVARQMKRHTSVRDDVIVTKVSGVTNDNQLGGHTDDIATTHTFHNTLIKDEGIQMSNTKIQRENGALKQAR